MEAAPTADLVRLACAEFDEENRIIEEALQILFSQYPKNDSHPHVLLKVVALNRLYSTNILGVHDVARHICDRAGEIDTALAAGSADIVDVIAKVTITRTGKQRHNWSFATKYCSWHNPEAYPIWDSSVRKYLESLKGTPFVKADSWEHYRDFMTLMRNFRRAYNLESFSFKEIDKFLSLSARENFTGARSAEVSR